MVADQPQAFVKSLDYMIDSSQIIGNAHQTLATTLESDVDQPLANDVANIIANGKVTFN